MDARKKVLRIDTPEIDPIREEIDGIAEDHARGAMGKDLHLVAAAGATDGLIASMDEEARELFKETSGRVEELKGLVWVNPCKPDDDAIGWLEDGAPTERRRQLGVSDE